MQVSADHRLLTFTWFSLNLHCCHSPAGSLEGVREQSMMGKSVGNIVSFTTYFSLFFSALKAFFVYRMQRMKWRHDVPNDSRTHWSHVLDTSIRNAFSFFSQISKQFYRRLEWTVRWERVAHLTQHFAITARCTENGSSVSLTSHCLTAAVFPSGSLAAVILHNEPIHGALKINRGPQTREHEGQTQYQSGCTGWYRSLAAIRPVRFPLNISLPRFYPPLPPSHHRRRQVRARALRAPVHRLAAERTRSGQGLPVRQRRHVRPRRVPQLPQEPLQHGGLRHQQGAAAAQRPDVHQHAGPHALQRWVRRRKPSALALVRCVEVLFLVLSCCCCFWPLPVYHYQLKIHFSSQVNREEMEPSLTVSLYGTEGEAENLELKLWVGLGFFGEASRFRNVPSTSFLVTWQEGKNCEQQDALIPAGDREAHRRPPDVEIQMGRDQRLVDVQHAEDGFLLVVRRLGRRQHGGAQDPHPSRRDAAEVRYLLRGDKYPPGIAPFQGRLSHLSTFSDRMVFCVKDPHVQSLTHELTFVRCKDAWRTNKRNPKRWVQPDLQSSLQFVSIITKHFSSPASVQNNSGEPLTSEEPSVNAPPPISALRII